MTVRTSCTTVTFTRPFFLGGVDAEQPAGTYKIETDEEPVEGLSFLAYRRVSTTIFLPSLPGGTVSGRVVTIDRSELKAAQIRDAESQ